MAGAGAVAVAVAVEVEVAVVVEVAIASIATLKPDIAMARVLLPLLNGHSSHSKAFKATRVLVVEHYYNYC